VLFADVAGSMDLQEQLDPEVWAQIMGRFVSILAEGVRTFGGTVDKFTGDGIMALFGAPVAQEDHARRACHAAWHLTKAIGEYSDELRKKQDVELNVRLGLNSGEVVVGRVGEDVSLDPTALGHTVGLAQRMEAVAEPGKAYLSAHTARLVEGWFELDDLGRVSVKGSSQPVRIFALRRPAQTAPVLHGGRLGPAPLVGRDRELAILEEALAAAVDGRAQVVGVVGEAGAGKSRLCDEFAASVGARGITVRRTAGVSHATDIPLLPILALLRDYFGILAGESSQVAREKVAARLLNLDPQLDEALPLIFDFLEVPDPERPAPRLAPEVRLRRIFDTLRRVMHRRSDREPLVLIFEDLHWFDRQSERFLADILESLQGTRTLVMTNFRPEFSADWMGHSYYRQLRLAPLVDDAVAALVHGLLGADVPLGPLLTILLERTGGNPFFVEEVIRGLIDDGTLMADRGGYCLTRPVEDVRVPPSVQAIIAARIDSLAGDYKAVLQTAAVIGREFTATLLAKVFGSPSDALEDSLAALCRAELLQRTEAGGYRFWHPLTHEVAYGSLIRTRREGLHGAVARALTEVSPEQLSEQSAVIAAHFERAGERLEAARWNDTAAAWAVRNDISEAMKRWRLMTQLLEEDDTESGLRLAIRARNRLIRFGARTGEPLDEAARLYEESRDLTERIGDLKLLASMTFAFGTANVFHGAVRQGFTLYLDAVSLAEHTGDAALEAAMLTGASRVSHWVGPLDETLRLVDRMVERCGGDPNAGVDTLGYGAHGYQCVIRAEALATMARLTEARRWADTGVEIHRERSELEMLAWTLTVYPDLIGVASEATDALARAAEAMRITEELGNTAVHVAAARARGTAQIRLGRFNEAVQTLEAALSEARTRGVGLFEEGTLLAHLAQGQLQAGDRDAAGSNAEEAVLVARREGMPVVETFALLVRGRVHRQFGRKEAAANDFRCALQLVDRTKAVVYEPYLREELAGLGNDEDQLRRALCLYQEFGFTEDADRLKAELVARSSR